MGWQNEILRVYLLVLAALLAGAGAALAILTWGLRKDVRSIWITFRSWLIMIPIVVGGLCLGRVATITLFVLLSIFAFKEFARATGLYADWWMTGAVYLAILALGLCAIVPDPRTARPGWLSLFMAIPAYAVAALLTIPILRNTAKGQLQEISLAILGFISIGWMFLHLLFLLERPSTCGYFLYLVFAVQLNDIAAFTLGRIFGRSRKRLLRSNISPGKTWEGAIGALAISLALPWAMRFSLPRFGPPQLILTGLIVGIGGQLGDLSISVIKRDLGVKDLGTMIPGHGGILDRIDSLIFAAPLFMHMVAYFYQDW